MMRLRHLQHDPRLSGFTLIELMIVIAIVAIIAALAGPGFDNFVKLQRLKGISGNLATDLAFARSEAVARGAYVHVQVQNGSAMSCYVIYASTGLDPETATPCDCTRGATAACTGVGMSGVTEVKTVQVPNSQGVSLSFPATGTATGQSDPIFNPRTGGVYVRPVAEYAGLSTFYVDTQIDSARTIRSKVRQSGRVEVCQPTGSSVGIAACLP